MMTPVHLIAMALATFRLTELIVSDKLTEPLRQRFPHYLWGGTQNGQRFQGCGRCVSVWAGAVAVGIFYVFPLLNWPLALSWLFIIAADWMQIKGMSYFARWPRHVLITADQEGNVNISRTTLSSRHTYEIIQTLAADMNSHEPV